jgi:hypothetical protein
MLVPVESKGDPLYLGAVDRGVRKETARTSAASVILSARGGLPCTVSHPRRPAPFFVRSAAVRSHGRLTAGSGRSAATGAASFRISAACRRPTTAIAPVTTARVNSAVHPRFACVIEIARGADRQRRVSVSLKRAAHSERGRGAERSADECFRVSTTRSVLTAVA